MKSYVLLLVTLCWSLRCFAVNLYADFPSTINANESYVFYSHGLIVEGSDTRPEHPKYGVYEFDKVKAAIFKEGDFNLIAYHRPQNTDIDSYVTTLENNVTQLLEAGVKPSKITLIGFSRGSHLTALASNRLNRTGINTVLLASCMDGKITPWLKLSIGIAPWKEITFGGNFLSIYETSDTMGSCNILASESPHLVSFKEVAITTGLDHGAFFKPNPAWVIPLKKWLHEKNR